MRLDFFYFTYIIIIVNILIMFRSFSLASLDIGYAFNLFIRYLILDILCSYGRQKSFGIMISV